VVEALTCSDVGIQASALSDIEEIFLAGAFEPILFSTRYIKQISIVQIGDDTIIRSSIIFSTLPLQLSRSTISTYRFSDSPSPRFPQPRKQVHVLFSYKFGRVFCLHSF